MMTPDNPQKQSKQGMSFSFVVGISCTLLGAFGGCTLQFQHDVGGVGGQRGPDYLLSGIGIGFAAGLIMAIVVKFFDQDP